MPTAEGDCEPEKEGNRNHEGNDLDLENESQGALDQAAADRERVV